VPAETWARNFPLLVWWSSTAPKHSDRGIERNAPAMTNLWVWPKGRGCWRNIYCPVQLFYPNADDGRPVSGHHLVSGEVPGLPWWSVCTSTLFWVQNQSLSRSWTLDAPTGTFFQYGFDLFCQSHAHVPFAKFELQPAPKSIITPLSRASDGWAFESRSIVLLSACWIEPQSPFECPFINRWKSATSSIPKVQGWQWFSLPDLSAVLLLAYCVIRYSPSTYMQGRALLSTRKISLRVFYYRSESLLSNLDQPPPVAQRQKNLRIEPLKTKRISDPDYSAVSRTPTNLLLIA